MRILKNTKNFIIRPLIVGLIQISIIFVIFFKFYDGINYYQINKANTEIDAEIRKIVNQCGSDYFASWLIINKKEDKKYRFKNVIACNKSNDKKDCSFSIKEYGLNDFYTKSHKLDNVSFLFLDKLQTGMVAYFNNDNSLDKYKSLKEALNNTNKKINSVAVSVTKDKRRNLVYVFTMSKTNEGVKCDKNDIVKKLEHISLFAKNKID